MPLRPFSSPLAWKRFPRLFHTSVPRRDDTPKQNHYETLQISTNATPAEVKKSFYALSKTHHPDRNPSDPHASKRFVQISEAYATLSTPAKRQQYDRDLHLHSQHSRSHHRPHGSYHSSGPAGGRPASGLSRRRTQFRGPPPSFYRSGGWGEHSAKRRAAQESGAPGAETPHNTSSGGGMGPGQTPFGQGEENDVPHFDREGHLNTQRRHSERWRRRKEGEWVPSGESPRSTLANFFFVGGVISLGIFVPSFVFERMVRRKGKEK
ncbi:DnaJ-domain-containing protein [Stipitochalara longipes BDJ]|nr:DnaJ-domain-containing protein [Stipitochalara longipes BDJ]